MTADPANAPHIVALVDTFPPLTAKDCERLAPLLRPGVLAVQKADRERAEAARRATHGRKGRVR